MIKVLAIKGGISGEREVSLRSGQAVAEASRQAGYEVDEFDYNGNNEELIKKIKANDVALPILHGKGGEDGRIQKIFEQHKIPYLGASSEVSELTFDKIKTHEKLTELNILMPDYEEVNKSTFSASRLSSKPFVLKPNDGGSSIDTLIAREVNEESVKKASELLDKYQNMLIEELIEGIEITVPVLDKKALPVIFIKPPEGGEFDYQNKYNSQSDEVCPAPISIVADEIQKAAQIIAEEIHNSLRVRHLSRTDFIISNDKKIYMLEINTMPGMTPQSLFPLSAKVAGMDMVQLTDNLIKLALSK